MTRRIAIFALAYATVSPDGKCITEIKTGDLASIADVVTTDKDTLVQRL